jgi:hypothetical protein
VRALHRLLFLFVTAWVACACLAGSHAYAATYPDPTTPTTVSPATAVTAPAPAASTHPSESLPFTGGDALMLAGFGAAVLVPGVALLVAARRRAGPAVLGH